MTPPSQPPAAIPAPLAPWGTRAAGALIDYLPVAILNLITFRAGFFGFLVGLASIGYWIYLGNMEGVGGQTPGKKVMGLRLVDASGGLIGGGAGIGRKFLHILDGICFIGFLLPLVDANRQTFADKLMTTFVVEGAERRPFSVNLWTESA